MDKIVPISSTVHAGKKLLPLSSFAFAAKSNLVPVVASEFAAAARVFPLVFHKPKDEVGVFSLLGLLNQTNLFVDTNGRWLADYIPATFRRYPFVIAKAPEKENGEDKFILCIDESSGLLSDEKGVPLFDDKGEANKLLKNAMAFVTEYQRGAAASEAFCQEMERLELLSPLKIGFKNNQNKDINMGGLLHIDEKKLNALDDEEFAALRKKGFLPMVYAHLISLANIASLIQRMKAPVVKPAPAPESSVPISFNF